MTFMERFEEHPVIKSILPYGHLIFAVYVCYLMGAYGISKVWLVLVGLAIWQIDRRWKKEEFKRRFSKMQHIRKSMIIKHETEPAEWLNVFIRKIWPRVTPYLADVIKEKLSSTVKELLEETKPPIVVSFFCNYLWICNSFSF
jgi:Ca2+-dependent lipid-binding protein